GRRDRSARRSGSGAGADRWEPLWRSALRRLDPGRGGPARVRAQAGRDRRQPAVPRRRAEAAGDVRGRRGRCRHLLHPAATDAIIEGGDGRIVLILRKNIPHGWAIPGGFVDYGEEVGRACVREAKEETGLDVDLVEQLFTYSDPKRDARKHTISTVYWCKVRGGKLQAADDAKDARWFGEAEVPW